MSSDAENASQLSSERRTKNCRASSWWPLFESLPEKIRIIADEAFKLFERDPGHPSLCDHPLHDNKRGRHRNGSRAVYVTKQYRAIYVIDGDTNVWYWIGTHNDYENFTGRK